jgi:hypothetical protein
MRRLQMRACGSVLLLFAVPLASCSERADLSKFEPKYVGSYRHTVRSQGLKPLPFLAEAQLGADKRFTMTSVPAAWLGYQSDAELIQTCSGTWRVGDDGDGSLTLEFSITEIDGKNATHATRARAAKDGFYIGPNSSTLFAFHPER